MTIRPIPGAASEPVLSHASVARGSRVARFEGGIEGEGGMSNIDLQTFCANPADEPSRPYIHKPFSRGDYTYATDGRIMVRVTRRAGIDHDAEQIKRLEAPLEGVDTATYRPLPDADLPDEAKTEDCEICDGRGTDHDCPYCDCKCEACDGSGSQRERASITIGQGTFDLNYVKQMITLPGIEIDINNKPDCPLLFRFKDGVGVLMPLRGRYERHFNPFGSQP